MNNPDKILRATELTGIIGRSEMDKLKVKNNKWTEYRKLYNQTAALKKLEFPIQLDFELNSTCNLKCPMCEISSRDTTNKNYSLFDINFFKEIIKYSVSIGTRAVKLNHINEPFIRPDIFKFIEYSYKMGIIDIYLSTNGTLLNKSIIKKILDSKLTRIQISIDATSEDIYNKMRPGGNFHKVVENTMNLIKERNNRNQITPLIRVNFVKTKINNHQQDEFIKKWANIVDMIGFQEYILPPTNENKDSIPNNKLNSNFKCSFPFKQLVITNEKSVLPCCTFWGKELELGKINNPEDIKKFWNCELIKNIRETHLNGEFYKINACNHCAR